MTRQPIDDLGVQKPSLIERLGVALMLGIGAIVVVSSLAILGVALVIGDGSLRLE